MFLQIINCYFPRNILTMTTDLQMLLFAAASIGFIHTLVGPDHYLPFIVMGKAGGWSIRKTLFITFLCGLGHVAGSVIIGFIGIAAGIAITSLEFIEGFRGEIATWILIAFGLVYMVWGIRKAVRNRPHRHWHIHPDGTEHTHEHTHYNDHSHIHSKKRSLTPWILFTIFILGPCEPLIPLLMYPAAVESTTGIWAVSIVFGITTIGTMMAAVALAHTGLRSIKTGFAERYMHALAGFTLLLCGLAMQLLGL